MATKAQAVADELPARDPGADATGALRYIAIPDPVYDRLSKEAAARGLTLSQFLSNAISNELLRTQPRSAT